MLFILFNLLGEEITLEYQFKVDSELEPEKVRLSHTVFYETDKKQHSTTFYNQVRKNIPEASSFYYLKLYYLSMLNF